MQNTNSFTVTVSRLNQGFTLIELMITIAIVAILSATAIAFYSDYVTKVRVGSSLTLVSDIQSGVEESYITENINGVRKFSTDVAIKDGLGLISADIIQSISVVTTNANLGSIQVIFDTAKSPPLLGNNILFLSPHINGQSLGVITQTGTISWECAGAIGLKAKTNFPTVMIGSVKSKFLPSECR